MAGGLLRSVVLWDHSMSEHEVAVLHDTHRQMNSWSCPQCTTANGWDKPTCKACSAARVDFGGGGGGGISAADTSDSPLAEFRMMVESMGLPATEDTLNAIWDQAGGDSASALDMLLEQMS